VKASSPPPPPAEPTPSPQPTPPTTPTWPKWHASADRVAAAFVLVAAFLAGSFAARNSDVWRHLAAGRLVASFDYPWGSDPFSFTAAGRPWVNTSWLYDLGLYVAYTLGPTGAVAVALKAVAFLAAFGLAFLLRRPGHSLWPWVVCVSLGVLAAAPSAVLGPSVASMLFLAVTLFLLFRGPWAGGKWRGPGVLAGVLAVWANVDGWFVLGPLTVLLVLVGELLQGRLLATSVAAADDPFRAPQPVAGLTRALLVGTAACLLNPTLLAGLARDPSDALGQLLPADLGWGLPAETGDDPDLAHLTLTPLSPAFTADPTLGNNLNGLAAVLLLLGGAVALAADYARLRVAHLLLWVGFAALALQSYRLIPFFAVVAVPLAAGHLNGLSARAKLRGSADPGTRVLLTLSGVGRIVTVPTAAVLAVAGWPGWLHPPAADPALARRAEWAIIADPGPKRAAEVLAGWRADGELNEVRGLVAGPDLGDYAAWFAPGEKTFVDSRHGFHRAELPDLLRLRRELGLVRRPGDPEPDPAAVREMVAAAGANYVVIPGVWRGVGADRDESRERYMAAFASLLFTGNDWRLWHLDGRAAVVGRADAPGADKLRFDPVRLAFGPDVAVVPKGSPAPPATARPGNDWTDVVGQLLAPVIARPAALPPEADDATVYDQYGRARLERLARRWQSDASRRLNARAAVLGVALPAVLVGIDAPPADDAQHAYPLLALRSARRAVALCPDRAEPFRVLAWAYDTPGLASFNAMTIPVFGPRLVGPGQPPAGVQFAVPGDRPEQLVTALVRALARLPKPEAAAADQALLGLTWNLQLSELYFQPPARKMTREQLDEYVRGQQLDLARGALQEAAAYGQVAARTPELLRRIIPAGPKDADPIPAFLKELGDRETRLTSVIVPRNDAVDQRAGDKPAERFLFAAAVGLPGKAIEAFKEVKDPNEFGGSDQHLAAALQMIELELRAGRLEDAAADVDVLAEAVAAAAKAGDDRATAGVVRYLRFRVARAAGNYEAAGEGWVELFAGKLPQMQPELRATAAGVQPGEADAAGAVGGGMGRLVQFEYAAARSEQAARVLTAEAGFHYNRAVLALQEGNIKEAAARFEQALKPQGLELTAIGDVESAARINLYLKLIRRAAGK
jgi:tetratricopeptide (TPR) repeat protein